MRHIISFLFLTLIILACHNEDVTIVNGDDFVTVFNITDTTGRQKTTFQSGEEFNIYFSVQNNTGRALVYGYTLPSAEIFIQQGDSLVTCFFCYLAFPQVFVEDTIQPGERYELQWRKAPNSPGRETSLILQPGQYVAIVGHQVLFGEVRVPPTDAIGFTVIP